MLLEAVLKTPVFAAIDAGQQSFQVHRIKIRKIVRIRIITDFQEKQIPNFLELLQFLFSLVYFFNKSGVITASQGDFTFKSLSWIWLLLGLYRTRFKRTIMYNLYGINECRC